MKEAAVLHKYHEIDQNYKLKQRTLSAVLFALTVVKIKYHIPQESKELEKKFGMTAEKIWSGKTCLS